MGSYFVEVEEANDLNSRTIVVARVGLGLESTNLFNVTVAVQSATRAS